MVAACNPHRGNSVASLMDTDEQWFRSSYYVRPLPPTLNLLKWDYGALSENDELEYIKEKLKLSEYVHGADEYSFLSKRIAEGQKLIRSYALNHLKKCKGISEDEAKISCRSAVSQRDIQRVFVIYDWLQKVFKKCNKYSKESDFHRSLRGVFVALAIAYYFRLNSADRMKFKEEMEKNEMIGKSAVTVSFSQALQDELDWLIARTSLPPRIAPTEALKENIYATVVCTMTKIPLIIVGPPGSSKTLSFKIVTSNLQGDVSETEDFRDPDVFKSIDPHYYQCSRHSTSTEIETVFERAVKQKKILEDVGIDCCSVVMMDEAGLPEERHESLKALHYFLDVPKVRKCFVYEKHFSPHSLSNSPFCKCSKIWMV